MHRRCFGLIPCLIVFVLAFGVVGTQRAEAWVVSIFDWNSGSPLSNLEIEPGETRTLLFALSDDTGLDQEVNGFRLEVSISGVGNDGTVTWAGNWVNDAALAQDLFDDDPESSKNTNGVAGSGTGTTTLTIYDQTATASNESSYPYVSASHARLALVDITASGDTTGGQTWDLMFSSGNSYLTRYQNAGNPYREYADAAANYANGTLTILPEPSTYALMLLGLGMVYVQRRRKK